MDESIVYAEIYEILNTLGDEYIKKIPPDLYEFINKNRTMNDTIISDIHNRIIEQKISNDAVEFVSLLNLMCWCSKEEQEELFKIYNANEKEYQKKINNIFGT